MEDVHLVPQQLSEYVAQAKRHNQCVQSRPHKSHLQDQGGFIQRLLFLSAHNKLKVDREYGAQLIEELGIVELIGGVEDDRWDEDMLDQIHRQAGRIWIDGVFWLTKVLTRCGTAQ